MNKSKRICVVATAAVAALCAVGLAHAQQANMTFFVTSAGSGKGADLGGLEGADRICQTLAQAAGAGGKTWRAYLSTQGQGGVNARDRVGKGPWTNAKGVVVAKDVAELHGTNNLTKQTALTEKGDVVNGRGDTPNMHDILTGSQPDGTKFPDTPDMTCGNWTKSGAGSAMVGHADRTGLDDSAPAKSWNSSHPSRGPGGGCSQDDLKSTGGNGFFYCFAANWDPLPGDGTTSPLQLQQKSPAEAGFFLLPVADKTTNASGREELRTVSRLCRSGGNVAPVRDALAGRERHSLLHLLHEEVEGFLRVRHDELELRKPVLIRLDVVAVLHFVETVGGIPLPENPPVIVERGFHLARICACMVVDRQQRVHRAGDGDQRLLDVARRGEIGHVRADVGERAPLRVL
jgi:hypothetical protein